MPDNQDSNAPQNPELPFYEKPAEEPDLRDPNSPQMLLNPLRRPRLWTWGLSILMFIGGMVLLLLPVTALYYLDDNGNPYDVETIYGTRTDQNLIMPSDLTAPADQPVTLVTSVRLGCGTAFNPGEDETKQGPDGPRACSTAEAPRTIAGWSLAGLGMLGFVTGFKLPSVRFRQ